MLRQLVKLNPWKSFNSNLLCSIEGLHTTIPRHGSEKTPVIDKQLNKIELVVGKYDSEQQTKILKIINSYNIKELLSYEISKTRANKLLAWRERYGLLKSLNDVLSIEGFGPKFADKFFQSLVNEVKAVRGQTRTAPFVIPPLESEQRKTIKSAVSVRIGVNSVTWSRLDIPGECNAPCILTHWQHHEISEKKLHINELIKRCLYVNHLIPAADCYLFENPQMAQASNNPGSVEQQNINIQKSQVIAMLGYALISRTYLCDDMGNKITDMNTKRNLPNVFYMRRFLSARLFNHLVGTERVSSEDTISNMMRTFYNTDDMKEFSPEQSPDGASQPHDHDEQLSGRVQFPMELREMFSKAPRYHREFLGQTLLLNLAFVRLVLLQDAESIAVVSRGGNNDKATLK